MSIALQALDPAGLDAFLDLHDRACFGGCYCAVWTAFGPDWGARCTARTPNRDHVVAAVEAGEHRGYLVRHDSWTGWVGAGPRRCFPGVERRAGARLYPAGPDDWILGCLALPPEARGTGAAHAVVEAVISEANAAGARSIHAFPVRPWDEPRSYRGSERLYTAHGFVVVGTEDVGGSVVVVLRRRLG